MHPKLSTRHVEALEIAEGILDHLFSDKPEEERASAITKLYTLAKRQGNFEEVMRILDETRKVSKNS